MRTARNAHGFTLIELMIVVVIIGILAAIAIPRFGSMGNDAKQKEADIMLKQIATLEQAFFAKCGSFTATLTATANDCNDLTDVGWEQPTPEYYQVPTVAVTGTGTTATFTATAAPNATTNAAGKTRVYTSSTGKITDGGAAATTP